MNEKGVRDTDKVRFWQSALEHQRDSGLSQMEYCRRDGLDWRTFSSWKKRLQRMDREAKQEAGLTKDKHCNRPHQLFAPVTVASNEQSNSARQSNVIAEITFVGGCIKVFGGAGIHTLQALVQAIKE